MRQRRRVVMARCLCHRQTGAMDGGEREQGRADGVGCDGEQRREAGVGEARGRAKLHAERAGGEDAPRRMGE